MNEDWKLTPDMVRILNNELFKQIVNDMKSVAWSRNTIRYAYYGSHQKNVNAILIGLGFKPSVLEYINFGALFTFELHREQEEYLVKFRF